MEETQKQKRKINNSLFFLIGGFMRIEKYELTKKNIYNVYLLGSNYIVTAASYI